jgi:hypothetical protein
VSVVLLDFIPSKVYTIQISVTPLEMDDGLIVVFKHSNSTSLYCCDNYIDDVDYFVVMA